MKESQIKKLLKLADKVTKSSADLYCFVNDCAVFEAVDAPAKKALKKEKVAKKAKRAKRKSKKADK